MPATDRLETLRDRIETADIDADDRAVLREFADALALRQEQLTALRREKLLRHVVLIAERTGGVAAALEDRDAAEDLVRWIHSEFENGETNQDYRVALRQVGRYCSDAEGDEVCPSLAWVSSTLSSDYDRTPDPSKMYRWEEHVQPMLKACQNRRDEAVIALQWDAGLRSGELHAPDNDQYVTIGDIRETTFGLQVSVDGKQGQRSPILIPSIPYVEAWLAAHPNAEEPDAPFVASTRDGSVVSKQAFLKIFRAAAERADMTPPSQPTPTRFRKSSASYHASQGLKQPHLEDRYGWVRGSSAAARYVSVFAEERRRAVAAIHGEEVPEDESQELAPLECPRCGTSQPRDRPFCSQCGQGLDQEAVQIVDSVTDVFDEAAISADDPDRRADLIQGRRTIEDHAGRMSIEDVHELASSVELDDAVSGSTD